MIVWDIETGPLDKSTVLARTPDFKPPERPGDFDPSAVKLGNLKDEAKIAAKIEAEREKHDRTVANYEKNIAAAKEVHESEAMEKAALSPITGEVLAIGYKSAKGTLMRIAGQDHDRLTEADLISEFWERYQNCIAPARKLVGHNIFGFDLPFLINRSWVLDITVPKGVIDRDRFWNERIFVDTMKRWSLGRYGEWVKLDTLSQLFGGTGKPEGVTGAMFADLIKGNEEEKKAAVDYLFNDLEMTWKVAVAMGVM